MNAEQAALPFHDAEKVKRNGKDVDLILSENEAEAFKNFKKIMTNED